MTFRLLLILLTFVAFEANLVRGVSGLTDGKCRMRGTCGLDPEWTGSGSKCLDCLVDEPPKKFTDESVYEEKLYKACPHFRELYPEGNPAVCCTEGQVDDLLGNFLQAEAILGRCPTCYYNFRVNFCDMTCAPTQDEFLKPLKVVNGSYAPCGAGGEEHSGGRPDVKRKFLNSQCRPKP